jgi:hypothetical protein
MATRPPEAIQTTEETRRCTPTLLSHRPRRMPCTVDHGHSHRDSGPARTNMAADADNHQWLSEERVEISLFHSRRNSLGSGQLAWHRNYSCGMIQLVRIRLSDAETSFSGLSDSLGAPTPRLLPLKPDLMSMPWTVHQ